MFSPFGKTPAIRRASSLLKSSYPVIFCENFGRRSCVPRQTIGSPFAKLSRRTKEDAQDVNFPPPCQACHAPGYRHELLPTGERHRTCLTQQSASPVYSLGSVSIAPSPQQFSNPGGHPAKTGPRRLLRNASDPLPLRTFCRI